MTAQPTGTDDAWKAGPAGLPPRLRRTSDAANAIFADPASRAFEERLALLAPTDATVLIIGETGTGKEVAARQLHALSRRRDRRFVAVNCGALSETLAESELFGYEKGAFTGAMRSQPGWFEAAEGGTLLLDEVGELPLSLQVKLLRVLQEREVTRLGARAGKRIDVRIVAATNVDLDAAVARGAFRKDLYFRINVASVTLRPLRERRLDIEPLAQHFLALYGARFDRPGQMFAEDALALLRRYDWPGNVRELDNVVHRAVLLNAGPVIRAAELSIAVPEAEAEPAICAAEPGEADLESALGALARSWMQAGEETILLRATRALVQAGFDLAGGNQVKAAELLGVTRNSLRTQLANLGVIAPRRRSQVEIRGWLRVRVGIQKFGTSSLLRFGSELERRLASQRILVDWRDFSTGISLVEALQAGEIDIGSVGEVPPVFGQASGVPVVYLAYEPAAPTSVALVVRNASRIANMFDLRGRRVALTKGANVHFLLLRALEMHGMSLDDIEPVYAPRGVASSPSAIPEADAWMMWDPFLSAVQTQREFRILFDGTGLVANHQFHVARRDFAEALPEMVHTILDETRKAGAEAAQRPADAAHRLAEAFGMVPNSVEMAVRRLTHGARRLDEAALSDQQRIADRFYEIGMLPKAISVAEAAWDTETGGKLNARRALAGRDTMALTWRGGDGG